MAKGSYAEAISFKPSGFGPSGGGGSASLQGGPRSTPVGHASGLVAASSPPRKSPNKLASVAASFSTGPAPSKPGAWRNCWSANTVAGQRRASRSKTCWRSLAGLREGRWKRAREIQQWLKSRHQIKLTPSGIYYWLGKLGGVLKVPRKTHAKKDARQAAEFQQTLGAKLKSLNVAGGKAVRIWVVDEHRYGLIPGGATSAGR